MKLSGGESMDFYIVHCGVDEQHIKGKDIKDYSQDLGAQIEFSELNGKKGINCFLHEFSEKLLKGLVLVEQTLDERLGERKIRLEINKFFLELGYEVKKLEPITQADFTKFLYSASRKGYIEDCFGYQVKFELVNDPRHFSFTEEILPKNGYPKKQLETSLIKLLCNETLGPELERISSKLDIKVKKGYLAIPAHYHIQTDDISSGKQISKIIATELYKNGRRTSRRLTTYDLTSRKRGYFMDDSILPIIAGLEDLYKSNEGGTILIIANQSSGGSGEFAVQDSELLNNTCRFIKENKHTVQTILCTPILTEEEKRLLYDNLKGMSLVEIKQTPLMNDDARAYLKIRARDTKISSFDPQYSELEPDRAYTYQELNKIFLSSYDKFIKEEAFPCYKQFDNVYDDLQNKPKGDAYKELMELIGIDKAKKLIIEAIDYFKAQKFYKEKGLKLGKSTMHMVFTGAPGTAKTTTARLLGRILNDNKVLSTGQFVEVGRADLVGMYVGHTAPKVRMMFDKAKGGVLFIDEAYSLVDDRRGLFGDEAISTIVQEMENMREDIVVIFAGYEEPMKQFISTNEGLRSRIAFTINFPDYTSNELLQIFELMVRKEGFKLDLSAREKAKDLFEELQKNQTHGNGRLVRNIFEQSRQKLAIRISKTNYESIANEDYLLIKEEDIEGPNLGKEEIKVIGF